MKLNRKLSRLGLVFMMIAILTQLDASPLSWVMFFVGEAMFLIWGGLDDMEAMNDRTQS